MQNKEVEVGVGTNTTAPNPIDGMLGLRVLNLGSVRSDALGPKVQGHSARGDTKIAPVTESRNCHLAISSKSELTEEKKRDTGWLEYPPSY